MAKPKKKKKNLFYRRASWDLQFDKNYSYKTLEEYLKDAHAMLCNVNERSCSSPSSSILCARDKITEDGIFLQIVTCNPGSDTSTISSDHKSPNLEVFSEPAPNGKDYLQGDIFVLGV